MQCVRYFQETGKKQFIDIKKRAEPEDSARQYTVTCDCRRQTAQCYCSAPYVGIIQIRFFRVVRQSHLSAVKLPCLLNF